MRSAADYGDQNAEVYDLLYPRLHQGTFAALSDLAPVGRILALGIGTGRCAAELVRAGREVVGVDASTAMLHRCRQRIATVNLVRGDLSALPFRAQFVLAYSLVSTFSLLLSEAQRCGYFAGVSQALRTGGYYLDESSFASEDSHCAIADIELTVPTQPPCRYEVRYRPIMADDFDHRAEAVGLRLVARWRDWARRPWRGPADANAVSVFKKL